MRCAFLLALVSSATLCPAQPPKKAPVPPPADAARPAAPRAPRDVYMPLPAIAVSGLIAEEASWSPDGRYLLIRGMDVPAFYSSDLDKSQPVPVIAVWTAASRKSTEIWRGAGLSSRIDTLAWLGTTSTALATVQVATGDGDPSTHLIRIDARRTGAEDAGVLKPMESLAVSPSSNIAALVAPAEGGAAVRVVKAAGPLPDAYLVPGVQPFPGWSPDGRLLVLTPYAKPGTKGAPREWVSLDLATGRTGTTKTTPVQEPERATAPSPVRLSRTTATLTFEKKTETVAPLWMDVPLDGPDGRYLVSPDAQWSAVSPRNDALAYLSRQTLFVAPLLRMDATTVNDARSRARDAVAASNAKQAMLAIIMYAADHDEAWPSGDEDLTATLEPYIKAGDILKDFHYLPPGGKMSDIESPATKVIGWVPAPMGYAVAFADGHVQLMPELPKN